VREDNIKVNFKDLSVRIFLCLVLLDKVNNRIVLSRLSSLCNNSITRRIFIKYAGFGNFPTCQGIARVLPSSLRSRRTRRSEGGGKLERLVLLRSYLQTAKILAILTPVSLLYNWPKNARPSTKYKIKNTISYKTMDNEKILARNLLSWHFAAR
jgi:hypothetical protein